MKTTSFIIGILAIGLVFGFNRNSSIRDIRNINASLRTKAGEIPELENEIARLDSIKIDTNALEKLRGETIELMRLRAEVGRLRPLANQPKPELEREINQSESLLGRAKEALDYEAEWIVENGNRRIRGEAAAVLSEKMSEYIDQYGRFPNSLELFRKEFSERITLSGARQFYGNSNLSAEFSGRVGVELTDFELNPPPNGIEALSRPYIVLKEKTPRQLQDGSWERMYGMLVKNPRVTEFFPFTYLIDSDMVQLEGGDFEKWEREFAEQNSSD